MLQVFKNLAEHSETHLLLSNTHNEVFDEWIEEGIIENVPNYNLKSEGYYLPHRHVVKLNSATTKLRPVFDASAKEKNHPSLNQCLDKGINLIELIPSILIRFRLHRIGVIADIRKAFLQISLKEEDRIFLRFLWYNQKQELKCFQHGRVVFGLTCSPFHLAVVIKYHLEKQLNAPKQKYNKNILPKLVNGFYVDNCVVSLENEDELHQFIKESSEVMKEVLGLIWNGQKDTLEINFDWLKTLYNCEIITKRIVLSIAHRMFDPIGFSCPIQIIPRILLRRTWLLKLKWDDEVPEEIRNDFLLWLNGIQLLRELRVPRWVLKDYVDNWSVHMFCDASQEAYAAAVFLCSGSNEDATIGARLLTSVIENFNKKDLQIYCWTDSTTVLSWIRREDMWKPFIWNRIQEIRSLTEKNCWFHVPGHMNPADLPSRGCSPKELLLSRWWEGLIYFSKYQKNLNQIAWIRRFIFNCQHKEKREKMVGNISTEEVENAEVTLIKMVQKECFNGITDKTISHFCPFFDEKGVTRIKTKITERNDTRDFIYPILLPSKHFVTEKIIMHYHLAGCHVGIQGLLCRLRERFWIISGRRTVKKVIYSFKTIDWSKIEEYSVVERIKWKFNPPGAAWWGGWWERVIRILKNLLRRQLGKASISFEELYMIICDCEAVINSRPLTYISETSEDLLTLTPAMFLQDIRENGVPDLDNIGDVVIIETENLKRFDWPLGVIEEIFPGKDGKSRLVRLRTSKGNMLRPIQRLYPLEIRSSEETSKMKEKIL
ncbi:hypothetical protein NQ317_003181 [Molorchus minor]|uniref:DUF5641 domain-containing protein n=1 Tax=Molorchus minor TaxID=1323400 RepID=A0ABQ9IWU6_9CUCU|nr:hypothetical protein NQ317_003181 [Molorchus minor]